MVIDIAAHISNLLYQNDCVNLPGLGRLFTQYQPAYIHHIEGIINPPSKSISFSEEIKEDNNALVNAISQSHHLNLLQAEIVMNDYVDSIKNSLSFNEEVDIPNVGKLYKDYESNIAFSPVDANYNLATFGLPELKFEPIKLNKELLINKLDSTTKESENITQYTDNSNPKIQPNTNQKSKLIWLIPIILGIMVAFFVYKFYVNKKNNNVNSSPTALYENDEHNTIDLGNKSIEQDNAINQNEEKIKQLENMPLPEELQNIDTLKNNQANIEIKKQSEATKEPKIKEKSELNTNPKGSNSNTCIVIAGAFRDRNNLKKLEKSLNKGNWTVYKDKKNGLYRIGVQFDFQNQKDKSSKIEEIRKIAPESWVLKN